MTLYRETPSGFVAWSGQPINEIQHPHTIEHVWNDAELAEIGLYRPVPAEPVPDGKIIAETTVQRVGGVVKFVNTLVEALAPTSYRISKADIWRRVTEDEADLLQAALAQTSVRLQGIFAGATYVSTDDDFYPMLRAGIVSALGEERTAIVLAPSEM